MGKLKFFFARPIWASRMKPKFILSFLCLLAVGFLSARAESQTTAPVPVRAVPPVFPDNMRREGVSGVVTVSFTVDESGNVQEPEVQKASHDSFVQPALDAVRKWKFKPALRDGTPIAKKVTVPIQFNYEA